MSFFLSDGKINAWVCECDSKMKTVNLNNLVFQDIFSVVLLYISHRMTNIDSFKHLSETQFEYRSSSLIVLITLLLTSYFWTRQLGISDTRQIPVTWATQANSGLQFFEIYYLQNICRTLISSSWTDTSLYHFSTR